jgi:hypothetical protein
MKPLIISCCFSVFFFSINLKAQIQNDSAKAWEIQADPSISGPTGQIETNMPNGVKFMSHLKVYNAGENKVTASWFGNSKSRLMPGNYDVEVEKYKLSNVPVEKGKNTRLLMGILKFNPRQSATVEDNDKQKFTMAGPFYIALPVGKYYINGKKNPAVMITDGVITEY